MEWKDIEGVNYVGASDMLSRGGNQLANAANSLVQLANKQRAINIQEDTDTVKRNTYMAKDLIRGMQDVDEVNETTLQDIMGRVGGDVNIGAVYSSLASRSDDITSGQFKSLKLQAEEENARRADNRQKMSDLKVKQAENDTIISNLRAASQKGKFKSDMERNDIKVDLDKAFLEKAKLQNAQANAKLTDKLLAKDNERIQKELRDNAMELGLDSSFNGLSDRDAAIVAQSKAEQLELRGKDKKTFIDVFNKTRQSKKELYPDETIYLEGALQEIDAQKKAVIEAADSALNNFYELHPLDPAFKNVDNSMTRAQAIKKATSKAPEEWTDWHIGQDTLKQINEDINIIARKVGIDPKNFPASVISLSIDEGIVFPFEYAGENDINPVQSDDPDMEMFRVTLEMYYDRYLDNENVKRLRSSAERTRQAQISRVESVAREKKLKLHADRTDPAGQYQKERVNSKELINKL